MNFRKYFEYSQCDDLVLEKRLFFNRITGNCEIIGRSGKVICIIPVIVGVDKENQIDLARRFWSGSACTVATFSDRSYIDKLVCSDECCNLQETFNNYRGPNYSKFPVIEYDEVLSGTFSKVKNSLSSHRRNVA